MSDRLYIHKPDEFDRRSEFPLIVRYRRRIEAPTPQHLDFTPEYDCVILMDFVGEAYLDAGLQPGPIATWMTGDEAREVLATYLASEAD